MVQFYFRVSGLGQMPALPDIYTVIQSQVPVFVKGAPLHPIPGYDTLNVRMFILFFAGGIFHGIL